MERQATIRRLQWNLAVAVVAAATVLGALLLAQLDALQLQSPQILGRVPIANVQATAIAGGAIINLPLTPLPTPDDLNPRPPFQSGAGIAGGASVVCGDVPAGWVLYTVQSGETLNTLAANAGTTVEAIVAANCLTDQQLASGMQIILPALPAALECGPPQGWARYRVQPGDTIGSLARRAGVSVAEILRANCRDSDELIAGQMIFLPGSRLPFPPTQPPIGPQPSPSAPPTLTWTPPPATPSPTFIAATPTAIVTFVPPSETPRPTATPPFLPTATATPPFLPTATPSRAPTVVPPTPTDEPPPTDEPTPQPTATPPIPPTNTPPPLPSDTPEPPTSEPPTSTPEPLPSATPDPEAARPYLEMSFRVL